MRVGRVEASTACGAGEQGAREGRPRAACVRAGGAERNGTRECAAEERKEREREGGKEKMEKEKKKKKWRKRKGKKRKRGRRERERKRGMAGIAAAGRA